MSTENPGASGDLRGMRILMSAFIAGIVMMAGTIIGILYSGERLETGMNESGGLDILNYVALGLAVVSLPMSFIISKVSLNAYTGDSYDGWRTRYQGSLILAAALNEGPALLAIVAVFLNGLTIWTAIAIAIGMAGLILHFPKQSDFARWLPEGH